MPVIIKSFVGIFFFALIVFLGIGIIRYQTDVNRASGYKRDVMEELQNSNFSPSVLNACIQAGTDNDYEVSIEVLTRDGIHTAYTKDNPAFSIGDVAAAYVTVVYKCRLPFLGVETSNSLRGFVR